MKFFIDIRRRIQLIQDFEMPDVSHTVNVSPDGRYVFATGRILIKVEKVVEYLNFRYI